MINIIGRAYGTLTSKLDKLFRAIFFYIVPRIGFRPVYRHYRLCRDGLLVFLTAFVLVPAVFLQLCYWVTVFACSSSVWRGLLDGVCVVPYPYASLMEQQAPWYTDLWSDQEAIKPNVSPPQRVKTLLVGYLHVCDSELYLNDYLNQIVRLPTKMKTNDLHQDLSKCTLRIYFRDFWRLG